MYTHPWRIRTPPIGHHQGTACRHQTPPRHSYCYRSKVVEFSCWETLWKFVVVVTAYAYYFPRELRYSSEKHTKDPSYKSIIRVSTSYCTSAVPCHQGQSVLLNVKAKKYLRPRRLLFNDPWWRPSASPRPASPPPHAAGVRQRGSSAVGPSWSQASTKMVSCQSVESSAWVWFSSLNVAH